MLEVTLGASTVAAFLVGYLAHRNWKTRKEADHVFLVNRLDSITKI